MRRSALPLLAVFTAGCTNFENQTTVIDLRMLGVEVEPSEIILDADISNPSLPTVDPANNPPVMLAALIADPVFAGRELTYTINACPNNPFAAAPPGGGQGGGAFPSGGARTTVGSALCAEGGDTTWFMASGTIAAGATLSAEPLTSVHPNTDQLLLAFMADIFPDQYGNLHGGFDLGMPLTLDITIDAGTEQIRGIKRVLYWARRINDVQLANENPRIDTLQGFYFRDQATFDPVDDPTDIPPIDRTMPPMASAFPVTEGMRSIWIMPSAGNAESYQTTVIDPDTHQAVPFTVERETLRYRFFASAGTFTPAMTSTELPPVFDVNKPIRIESQYNLPRPDEVATDAEGRAIVTIWVVVRDDRGGEGWQERLLLIKP